MPLYLNSRFDDGERLAVEIATVKGWADFCAWARALPPRFELTRALAEKGGCDDPYALYDELHAAAKIKRPSPSAEPDDSEFDEEEED